MRWLALLLIVSTPALAWADAQYGGSLRMRGDSMQDRDDAQSQGDVRARVELGADSHSAGVSMWLGVDARDETAATGDHIDLRYAYGQLVTPIGIVSAGRMNPHWGLGIFSNAGACHDCDLGDTVHRAALSTPIAQYWWTLAFDLQSTVGGFEPASEALPPHARTVTLSVLRERTQRARDRRGRAGKTTLEYGGFLSHRRNSQDASRATVTDAWARLSNRHAQVEAEAAWVSAELPRPMLSPGIMLTRPLRSRQFGAAIQSKFSLGSRLSLGLDGGFASGDPAPGFGAGAANPQAMPPYDDRLDNFRFHPSFRIDRILYQELIGTVTDSIYARPHATVRVAQIDQGTLSLSLFAVASWAVYASSTPKGARPLGLEIDPGVVYDNGHGTSAALEHAVLFPFAGLSGISGRAQLIRFRLILEI